jgi:collagen type VII alpha
MTTGTTGTTGVTGPTGPATRSFVVKSRTKGAHTESIVEATTREDAITQVVQAAAPGEEVDVMNVQEVLAGAGPTGTTGVTGTTGSTGASGTAAW